MPRKGSKNMFPHKSLRPWGHHGLTASVNSPSPFYGLEAPSSLLAFCTTDLLENLDKTL